MKLYKASLFIILFILNLGCTSTNDPNNGSSGGGIDEQLYFPPVGSNDWESQNLEDLAWNSGALPPLLEFLEQTNTRTFMILYKGRIVAENYFNGSDSNSNLPWFSAGKTLTAFMTGLAQEEGYLNLNDPTSNYLGEGWTMANPSQESQIKVVDHLTMTTGLDFSVNLFCTDPECLNYLNEAGSFWYYHNAPYTLTQSIITEAVNDDFDNYFQSKLRDPIGMQGFWASSGFNRFYFSNARSMARFGLLCLNEGGWDDTSIMNDDTYFEEMVNTSQNLNEAYGYLWWLNGKDQFRIPGSSQSFSGNLIPNAPSDLIAGLGANDQKLYIIPSLDLVIVRQGGSGSDGQLAISNYDNELWSYLSALIN